MKGTDDGHSEVHIARHSKSKVEKGSCQVCTVYIFNAPLKITGAGILEQSMGSWNRAGLRLFYRPARLQRLAESIP